SVSPFSPSQSVNLLMKCASYRRFAHASLRFKQIDRDDRRIWLVSANLSSTGKHFDNSKISIASTWPFYKRLDFLGSRFDWLTLPSKKDGFLNFRCFSSTVLCFL